MKTLRRHRGPRFVAVDVLEPGSCVPLPQLYGRVISLIRTSLDLSQGELGRRMGLPTSSVSKLEQGTITLAVHHLDELAEAFTERGRQLWGEEAPEWRASELVALVDGVARRLEEEGYRVAWAFPDDLSLECFVEPAKLGLLLRRQWPDQLRGRLGW